MKEKIAVVIALVAIVLGVMLAQPQVSTADVYQGDSPKGVTVGEFNGVHKGWPKARIDAKYDIHGVVFTQGDGLLIQQYKLVPSERPGHVYAQYKKRMDRTGEKRWHIVSQSWCSGDPQECRPAWPSKT